MSAVMNANVSHELTHGRVIVLVHRWPPQTSDRVCQLVANRSLDIIGSHNVMYTCVSAHGSGAERLIRFPIRNRNQTFSYLT